MQAAAISVRCNGPMGDEKAMKIYSFGEETKPAILLLPGTCCHWKRNFGHVIPLLQEHFYVLCASYDGFDETEDSTFPNMLIETAKLENYIQKNLGGQLFAAYGCSLGGSFVGLMVQRKKIHIRHGILGSSDLDQGSSFGTWAMAKAMTPLLGKMLGRLLSAKTFLVFVVLFLVFLVLYRYLPNRKASLKSQVPGAFIIAVAWSLFSYFFSLYFTFFPNFSNMYGSLSALIMVMLWLYVCMNLLLYGAEINAYFEKEFRQAQMSLWQGIKKLLDSFFALWHSR